MLANGTNAGFHPYACMHADARAHTHKHTKLPSWTFVTRVHHLQHNSSGVFEVQGPLYSRH